MDLTLNRRSGVAPAAAPRAAYIHVPFCAHRCGYCNFTLIAGRDDLIDRYLAALERELATLGAPQPVETLFLGGGTPTHLAPNQLDRLLSLARHWFPLVDGYEFSIEANPLDITPDRVAVLAAHGVNRVSLGAQSFDPDKLRVLERDHGPADVQRACNLLRPAVASLGLDLIFAAPGESLEYWQADVAAALAWSPDHVSTYGLTFDRGSAFYGRLQRGELRAADEALEATMYEYALDRLPAAGLAHYEISNFARAGHRCRHNEVYWAAEPYFAAGPGAARYVDGRRQVNHRSTTTWLARVLAGKSPVAEEEALAPDDRAREALAIGLRRTEGVERAPFEDRFGQGIDALLGNELPRLVESGLLVDDGRSIRLTRRGLLLADEVCSRIVER